MDKELIEQIKKIVAEEFCVPMEALSGKRGSNYISKVRHVFNRSIYMLGYSAKMVGQAVGKDHSTIVHSIRTYNKEFKENPFFKLKVGIVEAKIENTLNEKKAKASKDGKGR